MPICMRASSRVPYDSGIVIQWRPSGPSYSLLRQRCGALRDLVRIDTGAQRVTLDMSNRYPIPFP